MLGADSAPTAGLPAFVVMLDMLVEKSSLTEAFVTVRAFKLVVIVFDHKRLGWFSIYRLQYDRIAVM